MQNIASRLMGLCFCLFALRATATTYYVDINSPNPTPPFSGWSTAATNIQDAVNQTTNGDVVLVNPGVYGSIGYTAPDGALTAVVVNDAITLKSANGPTTSLVNGSNAMRCLYLSSGASLAGFTISNGSAINGGGLFCQSASTVISNCIVTKNSASAEDHYYGSDGVGGGGVVNGALYDCQILSNTAPNGDGGGAINSVLSNCTVTLNEAGYGGGVYQSTLSFCRVTNNSAGQGGGTYGYSGELNSCLVAGNSAGDGGGAFGSQLYNCTVIANYASSGQGGGAWNASAVNTIIYDNNANWYAGSCNFCCTTLLPGGNGNFTNAPLFVNEAGGDYHLRTNSPCLDSGNNSETTTTIDLDGNPRVMNGTVDLGAYEYQTPNTNMPVVAIVANYTNVATGFPLQFQAVCRVGLATSSLWHFGDGTSITNQISTEHNWASPGIYTVTLIVSNVFMTSNMTASLTIFVESEPVTYVNGNGNNPVPPYSTWNTAATNIQDAVNIAFQGETVLVTNGVYRYGGETINGGALTNRVAATNTITIQSVNGPAVTIIEGYHDTNGPDSNAVRCAYLSNGAVLSGFTLTNGATFATDNENSDDEGGGAMCDTTSILTNCVVAGNDAFFSGGGAFGGTLNQCLILGNIAVGNPGYDPGGGASASILNFCIITNNSAEDGGAAAGCTLNNCLILGNAAASSGGGAFNSSLNNCTVSENGAGFNGSFGNATYGCSINDSIVYYNGNSGVNDYGGTFNYSCAPDASGAGCTTNPPLFINPSAGNFRLHINSPCIDAGDNSYVNWNVDLDGNPRIVNSTVDIGAYEYQNPVLAIVMQPASQTNLVGQTGMLGVDAESPYPLTYQWFFNSNTIPEATSSNLLISNLQLTNTGYYSVMISNSYMATNSSAAFLAVFYPPPAILQEPTNLAVILASNTVLSVTATSYLNMTFQWQLNGTNLTEGEEFSGSTTSNLLISGAVAADGGNYDVIVSDSEWSVTSAVATVSILFPVTMTLQPTNETAVVPHNVSLSAAASGTGPLTFQWLFDGAPLSDGGNISGSASSTLNISGVQPTNAGLYEVLVTNSFSEAASTAMLTVLTPVQILIEPTNEAVAVGNTVELSVTATGTDPGYQWYFNGELLSDGNGITGSSTANLTITDVQNDNGGNYQVVVSNSVNTVASTIATLTPLTNPGPSIRYVNVSNSAPQSPYLTWSSAATNIQNAIDASISGDTIVATDGVYQAGGEIAAGYSLSNRVVINKPLTVQSVNGPGSTFIFGNQMPGSIYGLKAMRCVFITTNSTLIGFTLQNGATFGNSSGNDYSGGGVWCAANNVVISNCVIAANTAYSQGGGVYQGTLQNCTVQGNQAESGGGVANASVFRSLLVSNIASSALFPSNPEGGGAYDSVIFNSAIADNSASYEGGGVYGGAAINCTITQNYAPSGGGMANCTPTNCIIYYNKNFSGSSPNYTGNQLYYCCTIPKPQPQFPGNITNDPALASISHISLNSPCRGAGNPLAENSTDIDGHPWNNPPSIGCSEIPAGGDYGNLTVNISVPFTNQAPGYPLTFQAFNTGPVYTTVWNFGDGTIVTNAMTISHTWPSPGAYSVTLTGYNDTFPDGVTATQMITVAIPTVYYVNINDPNPVPPYSHWSTAATNIQDAVNLAPPGSVVLVTNTVVVTSYMGMPIATNSVAIYQYGGLTVQGRSYRVGITNPITVQSVNGPSTTYIEGNLYSPYAGAYLTNGAILSGFTITNGYYSNAGAGGVTAASTNALITNCVVTQCQGGSAGGAYSGTFNNCAFVGNGAQNEYGGGALLSALNSCLVSNNSAEYGGGVCGGTLNNCIIVSNSATQFGGGVYANPNYPVFLNNCVISNNAAQIGGGVYNAFYNSPYFTNCILTNCIIADNRVIDSTGFAFGAGAFAAEINNSVISSNQILSRGGGGGVEGGLLNNCTLIGNNASYQGISSGGGADGSYYEYGSEDMLLNKCTIIGNVSGGGGGANDCTLNGCTISQNVSTNYGGGVADSILNNCLVVSNTALDRSPFEVEGGGGAYSSVLTNCILENNISVTNGGGACLCTLVDCTIAANMAGPGGGGVSACQANNSILYYNNGGDYYPATAQYPLNYCCVSSPATNGIRNITNTPLFVNLAAGDFHLQPNSPCINSGNNAYIGNATDLDGNPRIAGGTVDIGAYEYPTPTSVISYAYLQQYGLPTDGSVDSIDLDGTGFTVNQDWIAGLNPTNPASVLAMLTPITTNAPTGVTVTWQSVSGIPYFLQRSTNLASQPPFGTIQSNIAGQTNTTSYTDTSATNNVPYFYRVGVVTP